MKKWEIKVEFTNRIVELPDDAVVIQYENDEDNGEIITYMVPVVEAQSRPNNEGQLGSRD